MCLPGCTHINGKAHRSSRLRQALLPGHDVAQSLLSFNVSLYATILQRRKLHTTAYAVCTQSGARQRICIDGLIIVGERKFPARCCYGVLFASWSAVHQ